MKTPKRGYELQRLHVYDKGSKNSISGIQATLFGTTSPLGMLIGSSLTRIGSQCIYPYRTEGTYYETRYKELRATADLGYKAYIKLNDFTDEEEIKMSFRESNVVICAVGNKFFFDKEEDYEDSNIKVPMAIAKSVK